MKVLITAILTCLCTLAQAQQIGTITQLKGMIYFHKRMMNLNDEVHLGDVLKSDTGSFAKIIMNDKTVITLGPSSEIAFTKFEAAPKQRDSLYQILKGQVRVKVIEKTTSNEAIRVASPAIALGVRGTEILMNAYEVGAKNVSDVALLTGKVEVSGQNIKSFELNAGEYFNSEQLKQLGNQAIKNLSKEALEKIQGDSFLPKLQAPDGAFLNALGAIAVAAPIVATAQNTPIAASEEKEEEIQAPPVVVQKQQTNGFRYELAKEPWDIRDNVMNYKSNLGKNHCYYYFYKKLPGGGEEERFRRERSCDDFEYEL